jgi:hypothetical protein
VNVSLDQVDNIENNNHRLRIFKELPGDSQSFTAFKLPQNTRFRFSVYLIAEHDCCGLQKTCVCSLLMAPEAAKMECATSRLDSAKDLRYKIKRDGSVVIYWKPAEEYGDNFLSLQVLCYQLTDTETVPEETGINLDSHAKRHKLKGLLVGSEYKVWIETESKWGVSKSEYLYFVKS